MPKHWINEKQFSKNVPDSFCLLPIFEKDGNCLCVSPSEYCSDVELRRHILVIIHLCRSTEGAWCVTYTHCFLWYWHFIFFFTTNHLLSQTEDFLLNNRTDSDTFQHNWIIKLSAPALLPISIPCQQWMAVEIPAWKPLCYWAGFCKSLKGKRRREKNISFSLWSFWREIQITNYLPWHKWYFCAPWWAECWVDADISLILTR